MNTDDLVKDKVRGVWAGCLAGIANSLDEDPAIVRIIFCFLTLATGVLLGLLIYFILMICMPSQEQYDRTSYDRKDFE